MMNSNPSELGIEIEEMLKETVAPKKTEWCIYRVPDDLREVNKDAYIPKVVSIGPLHYGNERLQNMEIHKRVYLKQFVERTKTNLNHLVSFIEELEPSVRHCYANNIMFNTKQLAKIILLDACFIIELFLRDYKNDWSEDDPLSPKSRLPNFIALDLLLLENQLPFFVLEKLSNWVFPSHGPNNLPSFLILTFEYFSYFNKQGLSPDADVINICHFTDLLRCFHLQHPSSLGPERMEREALKLMDMEVLKFTATKLHEAGLRFKVNDRSQCLLGLQFSRCVLEIPKIVVEYWTEVVFHNMMAFEQCHCLHESYITDFVSILDFLIDTNKDVEIFIQNGIIDNYLDDSNAVAKLFNCLGKNVIWANFNSEYALLCKKLNEFHENPYQKLKATLRSDYCKTPWQTAASIAGILLLFLTLLQSVLSVIQVMQQSKNA